MAKKPICRNCHYWQDGFCLIKPLYTATEAEHECDEYVKRELVFTEKG